MMSHMPEITIPITVSTTTIIIAIMTCADKLEKLNTEVFCTQPVKRETMSHAHVRVKQHLSIGSAGYECVCCMLRSVTHM